MPCFTDLSNELYFEILQHLPPPDLGSFYCVNKHLYALTAIHRINYQSLKRRFSTCLNTKQPGSTAKLIKSILADPQIALYVQHYKIDGCCDMWGQSDIIDNDRLEHVKYPASDLVQLEHAMQDSEYIPNDETDRWITALKEGEEDVLIALALTLLPNLTSIEFQPLHDFKFLIKRTIKRIADAKRSGGPLARLINVTISAFNSSESFTDPSFVEVFATLPAVKIINADRIYGDNEKLEDIVPATGSNVTDLNISNGDVSTQRLMLLLRSFNLLQSFTYWPAGEYEGENSFDAFSIVANLLVCAQDSLRELQIRAGSARQGYMGNLRGFRVLEYLETDTTLLFGDSESLVQTFQTSLPLSIREVKLHGKHPNSQAFRLHFSTLAEAKDLLPNLSSIELFETKTTGNQAATLKDLCAIVNISLKFVDCEHDQLPNFTRHRGHYAERQAKKALYQREVL